MDKKELPLELLVYFDDEPVGVIGLYKSKPFPDTIWLSWFGVLEKYRNNGIRSIYMKDKNLLDFYKNTSLFTDLGFYTTFAKNLPNDIKKLCSLFRNQIIHPFDLKDEEERNNSHSFYGDMTKISRTDLIYENDLFPTAIAMLAELLRRNPNFTIKRKIEDKIHVCCREMSILLVSILKSKGIPARCRSGFANYVTESGNESAGDHWITEYYDSKEEKWKLVDSDMCYDEETLEYYGIDFNLFDMPRNKFIFGAEAYIGLRNNKYDNKEIFFFSNPYIYGLKAAIRGLFYDFHCLMNDEIPFLYQPKYVRDKDFELTKEELLELDRLVNLMLDPSNNFDELLNLWNNEPKFRIMSGGMNN